MVAAASHALTVNFHYPIVLPASEYESMAYIAAWVKFKLGAQLGLSTEPPS